MWYIRPCLKYFSGSCCLWGEVQTPWHDDRALQHPICPTAFHPQRGGPVPAVPNCFTPYLPYLRAFAPAVPSGCHASSVLFPPDRGLLHLLDGILLRLEVPTEGVSSGKASPSLLETNPLFFWSSVACLFVFSTVRSHCSTHSGLFLGML